MSTNAGRMTQLQEASREQQLYERSRELRTYSNALLLEARDLCGASRRLRASNVLIAGTNSNPNAARKRCQILGVAKRFLSRPKSFSIDIPLSPAKQTSNERHSKVFDESRVSTRTSDLQKPIQIIDPDAGPRR